MVGRYLPCATLAGVLFVAAFALCARLADRLDRVGPARLSVAAGALCTVGVGLLEASPLPVPFVLGGMLSLAGCVALFMVHGKNLAFYNHQERVCQLAAAFVVGAALVALVSSLADPVAFTAHAFLARLVRAAPVHLETQQGHLLFRGVGGKRAKTAGSRPPRFSPPL